MTKLTTNDKMLSINDVIRRKIGHGMKILNVLKCFSGDHYQFKLTLKFHKNRLKYSKLLINLI